MNNLTNKNTNIIGSRRSAIDISRSETRNLHSGAFQIRGGEKYLCYSTTRRTKETPSKEIMFLQSHKVFLTSQNLSLEGLNCTLGCAWMNGRHQVREYRCPPGLQGFSHITAYSNVIVPMGIHAVALRKSYRPLTIFGYFE